MGVGDQRHAPAALSPPPERPSTHCTGAWVGLDGFEKSRPPPGFDPRTVQPVASRCSDRNIATYISITSAQIFKFSE